MQLCNFQCGFQGDVLWLDSLADNRRGSSYYNHYGMGYAGHNPERRLSDLDVSEDKGSSERYETNIISEASLSSCASISSASSDKAGVEGSEVGFSEAEDNNGDSGGTNIPVSFPMSE